MVGGWIGSRLPETFRIGGGSLGDGRSSEKTEREKKGFSRAKENVIVRSRAQKLESCLSAGTVMLWEQYP